MAWLGVTAAAAVALGWGLVSLGVGPALGLVDAPDDPALKVHQRPAVPLGGVGILLGVVCGMWLSGRPDPGLAGVAVLLVALGLVDDRFGLPPLLRLAGEAWVGVLVVTLGVTPLRIDRPLDLLVGTVLVVAAVNAVNLLDGLDALAGSAGLVSALGLALLAGLAGGDPTLGLVVAGALGGFLVLNRPPARVFLGDNGAYLLGLLLAVGALRASGGLSLDLPAVGLAFGVFGVDLAVTLLRRWRGRAPLFSGDRDHLYDRLHAWGMPTKRIALAAAGVQVGFVALAVFLQRAAPPLAIAGLAGVVVAVTLVGWRASLPAA